jgi:hypothetical protein
MQHRPPANQKKKRRFSRRLRFRLVQGEADGSPQHFDLSAEDPELEAAGWEGPCWNDMGMDQYLLIPFLVGWTSIY